ncbi:ATP-dependent helicase HrpB [Rhodovibrionaceae bacterium A322]
MPLTHLPSLPISPMLPELLSTLSGANTAVLEAPPGAGKTTLVPLALLDQQWLAGGKILMLEPRRLAARAAAERMAQILGEPVGQRVGYRTRMDSKVSSATLIEVMTEGTLLRQLQRDPELPGIGAILFDEFHERNLDSDLALAFSRDLQEALREDLRLLIMSATLDGQGIAEKLGQAPVVRSEGRSYPVAVTHHPAPKDRQLGSSLAAVLRQALADTPPADLGDVLVFLPGEQEIRQTAGDLKSLAETHDLVILPLFGALPPRQQQAALRPDPQGRRKVILSTAIAETSLTIDGVRTVIDCGLSREPRFDPGSGMSRLVTTKVSQAGATQRAGRAGRQAPGHCHRLWPEPQQRGLPPYALPEIMVADLTGFALDLAVWGAREDDLLFLDPPPTAALSQARDLLVQLEALDSSYRVTPLGRQMSELPLHPRLAHMLITSCNQDQGPEAAAIAAVLMEKDPLTSRDSNLASRLDLLNRHKEAAGRPGNQGINAGALARVRQTAGDLRRRLKLPNRPLDSSLCGPLLALAYPDRLAQRRGPGLYRLSGGGGARLAENDSLAPFEFLALAALDGQVKDGRIFLAASLTREDLEQQFAQAIEEKETVLWNSRSQSVQARQQLRLGALVLKDRPLANPSPDLIAAGLLQGLRETGLHKLSWSKEATQFRQRTLCLTANSPDQSDFPDFSDQALLEELEDWLAPFLGKATKLEALSRIDLLPVLKARLDWSQQQLLDQEVPTHLKVPSGSSIRLDYSDPASPALPVKLQELFGLAQTPTVARGRLPVTLKLLSPAGRPVQVTQDLANFWKVGYQDVKKDLKGRYPRHPWPDDPWTAQPTRRAKPRT